MRKTMGKKFWIFIGCIAIGLVSGPVYFWYQATRLPDWYSDRSAASNSIDLGDRAAVQQAQQKVHKKISHIQPSTDGKAEVELKESELNALIAPQVVRVAASQRLTPAVKQISTTIADGKIESGAVINLADLPTSNLSQNEQEALVKLVKAFPGLSGRQVYVGVEGVPAIKNGQINLNSTQVRIGNLRLSVAEVARQLGVSETALQEKLDRQISLEKVGIQDVQLTRDAVKIRGTAN
jgi:hypothetical protein